MFVVMKIGHASPHDALGAAPPMVEARIRVELADGQLHHAPQPFFLLSYHFALLVLGLPYLRFLQRVLHGRVDRVVHVRVDDVLG